MLAPFVLAVGLLTGCAASPAPAPNAPKDAQPIEIAPTVISPYSDAELAAQFEKAKTMLLSERYKEASEAFDKLVRLAPDGPTAAPSLYNGAVAREGMSDKKGALERFKTFLERYPDHEMTKNALVRRNRIFSFLEQWKELGEGADTLLGRKDLSLLETIEARGEKALSLVELDNVDEASKQVNLARNLIEDNHLGEGKLPVELAQVSFALGEVRRKKSERVTFSPLPPNFTELLEQRCQGLLEAQAAYTDTMRSFDPHWSAMAGYRVGQLYQKLHRDVMGITPPAKADTLKKKQLFEGAMRLRYRVLLEKGLAMMDATVRIGQRTGEDSAWIHRAVEAKRDLDLALADERAALAKMPFTEDEVKAALDQIRAQAKP